MSHEEIRELVTQMLDEEREHELIAEKAKI